MIAPVAVFGIGNRSRGDDAVGPLLLDRLRDWLESRGLARGFELFEEYQLQVENALDLEGRELALFVDARLDAGRPVTLEPVADLAQAAAGSSHALLPGAVLGVYRRVTGRTPPPAFALGVRAERFELGEGPVRHREGCDGEGMGIAGVTRGRPTDGIVASPGFDEPMRGEAMANRTTHSTARRTQGKGSAAPAAGKASPAQNAGRAPAHAGGEGPGDRGGGAPVPSACA